MTITSRLFEAFLKCPTKCFLRSLNETATGNAYADWVGAQQACYRSDGIQSLREGVTADECITGPLHPNYGKPASWRLAIDCLANAHNLESTIHAVERVPSEARGKAGRLIPIRFTINNRLSKDDRMLVAFDALVLSEALKREVGLGKIIHGDRSTTLEVKTGALASEARKLAEKIDAMLSSDSPPDLVLNRHCADCEFQTRCRQKAIEMDDLSLLSGMTANERAAYRSKGIFTVRQLSYTFRPRKTPKRAKNPAKPRYMALQALAIRENTVYMHGNPQLPDSKTQVYLDIEGLPDSDFYYLIGALVVSGEVETFHSFWAEKKSDEPAIFAQLVETIRELPELQIFHYGRYERVALLRMKARLPEFLHQTIDALLERATNVLSVIHPHVYFPTYSNGLKDIGRFLQFERAQENVTGLQSIVWRMNWEASKAADVKARLLQYNRDDCRTLKHIFESIARLTSAYSAPASVSHIPFKAAKSADLTEERPRWDMFGVRVYTSGDLKEVAKCSYFDYQREKIYVRTHPHFKVINKNRRKFRRAPFRINKVSAIESQRCPECQSKKIEKGKQMGHDLIDLKFFNGGLKKWITRFVSWRYRCSKCKHQFSSEKRLPIPQKYGHGLMSWCVYCNVTCGLNMRRAWKSIEDVFGLVIPPDKVYTWKGYIAVLYESLCSEILQSVLASPVIHIDETTVRIRDRTGYVWVMTTMDKVYYFYKPSREGSFLQEMLRQFSGTLVSDFYTAYDSLPCKQQKCLLHLIRDIDDDVLRNPLDTELKGIAEEFGSLLRTIIETVNRYGLKSRHLRKHERSAFQFLDSVGLSNFSSELANKYKKRFQKSGQKMFTFLAHDGVPWNNNNAEHAIKRFAKFRRDAGGRFTERTLKEYLVLASVFETCEFNNVNVLKFMLSKETTLEGLLKMAGRRAKTSSDLRVDGKSERGCQSGRESRLAVVSTEAVLQHAEDKE